MRAPAAVTLRACLLLAAATGCQLVAPFDSSELGCPCPDGYACEEGRCRFAGDTEDTVASCRDGYDNDGDGAEDCEDTDCREAGACQPHPAECDPFTAEGCPAGLTCALRRGTDGNVGTVCRDIGQQHVGEPCEGTGDPDVLCLPGAACVLPGGSGVEAICQELCSTDADCGEYAICGFSIADDEIPYGLCTMPCLPWASRTRCAESYVCRPVGFEEDLPRTAGGTVTTCLHPNVLPVFGDLDAGGECDPRSTDSSDLCIEELMCAPITGRYVCVHYCDVEGSPSPACDCRSLSDGTPDGVVLASGGSVVGVCYGDAS